MPKATYCSFHVDIFKFRRSTDYSISRLPLLYPNEEAAITYHHFRYISKFLHMHK